MTLGTFIARLYTEVQNKGTNSLAALRQITMRQLQELSIQRTSWMEGTATWTTVAGQERYDASTPGFPPGVLSVDRLYYTVGLTNYPVPGPVSVDALRFNFPTTVSRTYPQAFAFQGDTLLLTPVSAALTMTMDFFRDATRDAATGELISDSPFTTNAENPWFERGELALRYAVLAEYYAMPAFRDAEAAETCRGLRNLHLNTIRDEYTLKRPRGGQVPAYLGGFLDMGTHAAGG